MRELAIEEAPQSLRDMVEAAINGETVVIVKDHTPLVQLVPITKPRRAAKFGSARGGVFMADDFDAPLADFSDYMP